MYRYNIFPLRDALHSLKFNPNSYFLLHKLSTYTCNKTLLCKVNFNFSEFLLSCLVVRRKSKHINYIINCACLYTRIKEISLVLILILKILSLSVRGVLLYQFAKCHQQFI